MQGAAQTRLHRPTLRPCKPSASHPNQDQGPVVLAAAQTPTTIKALSSQVLHRRQLRLGHCQASTTQAHSD